jgi:hypothetical protein
VLNRRTTALMCLAFSWACASRSLSLRFSLHVPESYSWTCGDGQCPSGQPEAVRYENAYEAFWWHCIVTRSDNVKAECSWVCSGTPAATYGCAEGAQAAERQIDALLRRDPSDAVQTYLREVAGPAMRDCDHFHGYGCPSKTEGAK